MILDTYYETDVPGLYINLALGRIENSITISLDDRVVWTSAWLRAVLAPGARPWAVGRATKMLTKDDSYCIPDLCIITRSLDQRLYISQTRSDDHRVGIDLRSCLVGAVANADVEVSRTCQGQNALLSIVPNNIRKIHVFSTTTSLQEVKTYPVSRQCLHKVSSDIDTAFRSSSHYVQTQGRLLASLLPTR